MKFIDAIFCDDIRHEINNKLSLMGLYNDQLILSNSAEIKWPVSMNLSLLLRFQLEKKESNPDHFYFEFILNKKNIVTLNGKFDQNNNQTQFILAIVSSIPLEPGDLGFIVKLYRGEELLLMEQQEKSITVIGS